MNKFSVGDVVFLIDAGGPLSPEGRACIGQEGEILATPGTFSAARYLDDYRILLSGGMIVLAREHYLRKRRPPEDNLFTEWFKSHILTDCAPSLEETMKTAQKNLASYTQEGSCG